MDKDVVGTKQVTIEMENKVVMQIAQLATMGLNQNKLGWGSVAG